VSYTQPRNSRSWVSESLRLELASFKIGVSVLCPGPVNTKIISNSNATRPPSSATAQETKMGEAAIAQANAFLAAGVDPDEVGKMVLAAVKTDRLYIHTDRLVAGLIEARAKALLEAIPPAK
jgi:short-subunit dehydrogenase